jgi:hypothetical protein
LEAAASTTAQLTANPRLAEQKGRLARATQKDALNERNAV